MRGRGRGGMRSAMGTVLKVSGWMHNCLKVRFPSFLAVDLTVRIFFYQKTRGGCITPPPRPRAVPRRDDWGGGRGQFEVDSFHSPPLGMMLNVEKFAGDRSPRPPPPRCRRPCPGPYAGFVGTSCSDFVLNRKCANFRRFQILRRGTFDPIVL